MNRLDATPMKITAIAPWFGSKRNLAPEIVAELGPHRSYWEPFCGSMAVLLEKKPCGAETVNDINGDVTNLAMVVASDQGPDLFERLSRTAFCDEIHAESKRRMKGELSSLDRAYWYFVECWMGRNGVAGTRSQNTSFCLRFTSNGGDPATRFRNAIESIPSWWQRFQGVWILNKDGFTLIESIEDKEGTAIYCDPPYLVKGAKYVHDFKDEDHDRLAALLGRFNRTRCVVSYYEHPRLAELYPGWTKRTFDVSKAMACQGKRDKKNDVRATEVLLINGPSIVENKGLFK